MNFYHIFMNRIYQSILLIYTPRPTFAIQSFEPFDLSSACCGMCHQFIKKFSAFWKLLGSFFLYRQGPTLPYLNKQEYNS